MFIFICLYFKFSILIFNLVDIELCLDVVYHLIRIGNVTFANIL